MSNKSADAVPVKKGQKLRAIRDGQAGYTSFKKGTIRTFHSYANYYGRCREGFRTSAYGSTYRLSDFEVVTDLEAAEIVLDQLKAAVRAAQAKVDKQAKVVEGLKNPPWKKGDKFKFSTRTEGIILHIVDDIVTYRCSDLWAMELKEFKKKAMRL